MTKSWAARLCRLPQQELFVAQELIKKVKLKCCGIKVNYNFFANISIFSWNSKKINVFLQQESFL
jgi:hypothetical protein